MIRTMFLSAMLAMIGWPGIAHAGWQKATSRHFIVYADVPTDRLKRFTERLEKFDAGMRALRGVPQQPVADADRVRVFMTGDIAAIQQLYGKGRSDVAGFYESRVGGPIAFVPRDAPLGTPFDLDAQSILFHEYAHHFMYLSYPNTVFPAWFSEGFAEFHATAIFDKDGSIIFGQAPGYRQWTMGESTLLPAQRLVQLNPGLLNAPQMDALYARGWLLTHFLTFEPSRHGQLGQYIAALNAGKKADEAAKVFGDLRTLDGDMSSYLARSRIVAAKISPALLEIAPIAIRPLTAGEAAVMPALLRTTRGVDPTSAQEVVKLARTLAAPFANDAGAQNELAEAEYDAGNYAESDAAATRALAVDPKSIHALIYRGMAQSAQLAKAEDRDAEHWRVARHWFVEADRADPDNPQPLSLFYASFRQGHLTPTRNAEDGLLGAYLQAPFAFDLRMTAADILLHRGDKDGARTAVLPVAYSPHRAGDANVALKVLTAIDAGDLKEAAAILDRGEADAKATKPAAKDATS